MKKNTAQESEYWSYISGRKGFKELLKRSEKQPQVIYKHSGRCSVSYLSKQDLEENMDTLANLVDLHLIDVVRQKELSLHVAEALGVRHESPQLILIEDGRVSWSGSHWDVKAEKVTSELN